MKKNVAVCSAHFGLRVAARPSPTRKQSNRSSPALARVFVVVVLAAVGKSTAQFRIRGVLGRWLSAICQPPSFPETSVAGAGQDARGPLARGLAARICRRVQMRLVEEGEAPSRAEVSALRLLLPRLAR
jgi:hypothetical protein